MTPPITIVERPTRVGVLGHLDELERLMREYCNELRGPLLNSDAVSEDLTRRLSFSGFLAWLRQCQREAVAGGYGHSHGKRGAIPDE